MTVNTYIPDIVYHAGEHYSLSLTVANSLLD